jgi:hypothetical protein
MTDNTNILDALIYTSIKNNLNKDNSEYIDKLKSNLKGVQYDINSPNDYDTLLSSTTIKKACCNEKESKTSDDEYETDIVIFDKEGKKPYVHKSISVKKSFCTDMNLEKNNSTCSAFRQLYCENSNYLYNLDGSSKQEIFSEYSPYCSDYILIKTTQANLARQQQKEAQKATDKEAADALEKAATDKVLADSSKSDSSKSDSSDSSGISKTTIIIIVVVIVILLIMSAVAAFVLTKKSKQSKQLSDD